ncbi:MAG TPA: 2-dehydropantoate 2-reductase [Nitrospirales bacterium]|nr:2-dehydropantoate 2-reductase [Nitrospirales bacterium]
MKQILFVGAGSVGGYFGAHLARHNPNVSFLLRPRTREAVAKNGLSIRSAIGESFTVHPTVASDPEELPQPDLIVLGIKAYDLDAVMNQIEPVLKPDTVILTLQNGVTIEDTLMVRFGRERIVGGVAFIYSKIAEPGVIDHYKKGMLTIGEPLGMETPRLQAILALLKGAGIPCFINPDIRRAKWEKMCWNCVFNPLTVLLNDRVAKALDHPEFRPVIATIVREVSAVAMAAHRVPLDEDMPEKVVKWAQELRDIHTSMYDDWKAGRPTEIDELNGFITEQGKAFGVPTPMNDMLTALIKALTGPEPSAEPTIQIEGAIMQSLHFTRTTLTELPTTHQVFELPTLLPGMNVRGVKLQALLDVVTLNVGADHVTFESQDGKFSACLTIKQAADFGILVYEQDGAPFPSERGGPFRLVTPGLGDLCANVKQVGKIIFSKGLISDSRPPQVCPEKA